MTDHESQQVIAATALFAAGSAAPMLVSRTIEQQLRGLQERSERRQELVVWPSLSVQATARGDMMVLRTLAQLVPSQQLGEAVQQCGEPDWVRQLSAAQRQRSELHGELQRVRSLHEELVRRGSEAVALLQRLAADGAVPRESARAVVALLSGEASSAAAAAERSPENPAEHWRQPSTA
jgi:hypothetical protein